DRSPKSPRTGLREVAYFPSPAAGSPLGEIGREAILEQTQARQVGLHEEWGNPMDGGVETDHQAQKVRGTRTPRRNHARACERTDPGGLVYPYLPDQACD